MQPLSVDEKGGVTCNRKIDAAGDIGLMGVTNVHSPTVSLPLPTARSCFSADRNERCPCAHELLDSVSSQSLTSFAFRCPISSSVITLISPNFSASSKLLLAAAVRAKP